MRFLLIFIPLLVLHLIPNLREWLLVQDTWVQMCLHHFFHANIFHIIVNAWVLSVFAKHTKWWQYVVAYTIASISILVSPAPVLGMSNVVYSVVGLRTPSFDSKWWKSPSTIIFLCATFAMLFFPNVSAVTHIVCFVAGLVFAILVRWYKIIRHDSARYI